MKFLRAAALAVILAIATQSSANAQSAPPITVRFTVQPLSLIHI